MVTIEKASAVNSEIVEAASQLLLQLSESSAILTEKELGEIVQSDCSQLLLARDAETNQILGMLTLVMLRIPSGRRAWIEDVVVDSAARREGIGEILNRHAIAL